MAGPTNALTYNLYVTQLATLAVVQTTTSAGVVVGVDAAFNTIIPQALNYAEMRIQRDCDLEALQTSSSAYSLTSGSPLLSIPTADFVTIQTITPQAGASTAPLLPVAKEFLQAVYPTSTGAGVPLYFAPYGGDQATAGQTSNIFLVGPWPDQSYPLTVVGTQRMPSLYLNAGNSTDASTKYTWISTWLPDLLLMASMIYVSAFQRNWGKASDDPEMAMSYEQAYQNLLKGAAVEEARKRFSASAWSSMSPPVAATPGR